MRFYYSGAVLVAPNGHIGLEVRRHDDTNPGLWGLIGGGKEADETPHETMLREIAEETGEDPAIFELEHRETVTIPVEVTGRDELVYSIYEGRLPDCPLNLLEAGGMVLVAPADVRAGLHNHNLTSVARFVLGQLLGE